MDAMPLGETFATALSASSLELLARLDARAARFLDSPLLERFSVRSTDGGVHTEVREIEFDDPTATPAPAPASLPAR